VVADGPLYVRGKLSLVDARGDEIAEMRAALCRCGASGNKPFCDSSHREIGFADPGAVPDPKLAPLGAQGERGRLRITPTANGPLRVEGPLELVGATGETIVGRNGALCRCGASANKPFCDGSHVAIGFEADT
jgi:CDGSH-type Zn-finger protein